MITIFAFHVKWNWHFITYKMVHYQLWWAVSNILPHWNLLSCCGTILCVFSTLFSSWFDSTFHHLWWCFVCHSHFIDDALYFYVIDSSSNAFTFSAILLFYLSRSLSLSLSLCFFHSFVFMHLNRLI